MVVLDLGSRAGHDALLDNRFLKVLRMFVESTRFLLGDPPRLERRNSLPGHLVRVDARLMRLMEGEVCQVGDVDHAGVLEELDPAALSEVTLVCFVCKVELVAGGQRFKAVALDQKLR